MELWGIEFPDDEVQVFIVDGEPQMMVNAKGARRLAENAPNKEAAAEFIKFLEAQEK